jgi:hypothetical protein
MPLGYAARTLKKNDPDHDCSHKQKGRSEPSPGGAASLKTSAAVRAHPYERIWRLAPLFEGDSRL